MPPDSRTRPTLQNLLNSRCTGCALPDARLGYFLLHINKRRRLLRDTKYVWLKRPENLTEGQAERRASLASEHLLTARACAMV